MIEKSLKFKVRSAEAIRRYELEVRLNSEFKAKLEVARLEKFKFEKAYESFKKKTGKKKTKAMEIITQWMKTKIPILVLASPPGTGKTFAAAFWIYKLWKKALYKNYNKLTFFFVRERELFGSDALPYEEREEAKNCARSSFFLVIDDFGQVLTKAEGKEWREIVMYYESLIDSRISIPVTDGIMPRTIMTTNLTAEDLGALLKQSKRLKDRWKYVAFKWFTDISYRKIGIFPFSPSKVKTFHIY